MDPSISHSLKTLACCPKHPSLPIEWVCLEKTCDRRLLCQFCVIYEHKDVHKNFSHISQILTDPLLSLQKLNIISSELESLKPQKQNFKLKIEDLIKREEEKLDLLLNGIVMQLSSRFEQIRKNFHDDLGAFIKSKEKEIETVDSTRSDYVEFVKSYFPQLDFKKGEQVKEGIDIVLAKFFGDEELLKNLKITQDALPLVKVNEKYDVTLNKKSLEKIQWRVFTDKGLNLDDKAAFRYDSEKTCGDITFSNDDSTVKKKGANVSSTVLGENLMKDGEYDWEVEINEMNGSYVCIGMIKNQEWNLKADNYTNAHCVCSDGCSYGMNQEHGNLSMNAGDVISFNYNSITGKFTAKGPNDKYVYSITGMEDKEFILFLGFASGSTYKVTVRGL